MTAKQDKIKVPEYTEDVDVVFAKLDTTTDYYLEDFDCGNETINNYIREKAINDVEIVAYLSIDKNQDKLISFLAISCSGILTDVNGDKPYQYIVPAIEVKYFAVNTVYQHLRSKDDDNDSMHTLSYKLFLYYVNELNKMSKEVCGANKIILYSVEKAYNFYVKCLFEDFAEYMIRDSHPYTETCKPMFVSLK